MKNHNCEICSSSSFLPKYIINNFKIIKCVKCGLVKLDHSMHFEMVKDLYKNNYFSNNSASVGYLNYFETLKGLEKTYRKRRDQITRIATVRDLLDVGTGNGLFLKVCREQHINAEGIEISTEAVEYARNVLKVRVYHTSLEEFNTTKTYDVVTAWDVLEHSTFPNKFLSKTQNLLNKNGHLIFSTGNIDSIVAKLSGKYWHLFNLPDHLFFYSEKTIRMLLEKNGFKVVSISYPYSYYNFSYLIERFMKKFLNIRNPEFIVKVGYNNIFKKITLPLNLFDIMEVVAVKI